MFTISRTTQFKRDLKKVLKRGKNINVFKLILRKLAIGQSLPTKFRNHKLQGNYRDCWECHIEPDWLLIYRKLKEEIRLERTGSHSDLFG